MGDEAVRGAFNQFFNRFEANALNFRYDWVVFASRGGSGWFAGTTTMEAVVKGEKKERSFNMSGNLRKEKGKWRIVAVHISRLRAEEQPAAGMGSASGTGAGGTRLLGAA
ncbi:MAG TPA: nuclear transport factor 2 family protein [Syntrophobacteraceae bacterium]|nr:nuclear transport factor 2 family protein [Syntrophobacteraceae bacterium]